MTKYVITALSLALLFAFDSNGQVATGGTYTLEQQVVAGGGGSSNEANYAIEGTIGQSIAGTFSTSSNYGLRGGFWQPIIETTAAHVSVAGQVLTSDGRFIGGARVILVDSVGRSQQRVSNPFGYFRFDNIEVGQSYVLSVMSKQHIFVSRVVNLEDAINDLTIFAVR
jgi:hypothetical protein